MVSSVQFSHSVVSDSLWPHESQHARPPCPSPTPGVYSDSRPSSQWCPQSSHPLSSPSPPAPNPSQHQSLFQWVNTSHEVAKVLEFQLQHHSFQRNPRADLLQNGLVGSPCTVRTIKILGSQRQIDGIHSTVPCEMGKILYLFYSFFFKNWEIFIQKYSKTKQNKTKQYL